MPNINNSGWRFLHQLNLLNLRVAGVWNVWLYPKIALPYLLLLFNLKFLLLLCLHFLFAVAVVRVETGFYCVVVAIAVGVASLRLLFVRHIIFSPPVIRCRGAWFCVFALLQLLRGAITTYRWPLQKFLCLPRICAFVAHKVCFSQWIHRDIHDFINIFHIFCILFKFFVAHNFAQYYLSAVTTFATSTTLTNCGSCNIFVCSTFFSLNLGNYGGVLGRLECRIATLCAYESARCNKTRHKHRTLQRINADVFNLNFCEVCGFRVLSFYQWSSMYIYFFLMRFCVCSWTCAKKAQKALHTLIKKLCLLLEMPTLQRLPQSCIGLAY